MLTVLSATALRLADLQPIRSPVAGADEVRCIDEALHQPGTVTVLRLVVGAKAAQHHGLHHRGQVLAIHCGADQKPAHAHDPMHLLAPQLGRPPDPAVTIGHLQRRSTEAKTAQPAVFAADQVAHLRAYQRPRALRVLTQHQLVPHAHQLEPVDDDERQTPNIAGLRRYIHRSRYSLVKPPWALDRTAAMQRRRQHPVPGPLHFPQRLDAARPLRPMAGIKEAKVPTDRIRKRSPSLVLLVGQELLDRLYRGSLI